MAITENIRNFVEEQIANENLTWSSQNEIIRAAGEEPSGQASRALKPYLDQFILNESSDTDLFRKYILEKISELKPGEKITFQGKSPKAELYEDFAEWLQDSYGRKPKISADAIRDIVLNSGATRLNSEKGRDPRIKQLVEFKVTGEDPREYYKQKVKEKFTHNRYKATPELENDYVKYVNEQRSKGTGPSFNLNRLLSNFLDTSGREKLIEEGDKIKGNKLTEPELDEKLGYRSKHAISFNRNIAQRAKAPYTGEEKSAIRVWNWVKKNFKPKLVVNPLYGVTDQRRKRYVYSNPSEKLIQRFNEEARYGSDPKVTDRIKKIWNSTKPIKDGQFKGKTLRQVLNSGVIHNTMFQDINSTLNTDYTNSQAAKALRYITRALQGRARFSENFIRVNKDAGAKLVKIFSKAKFGNPLSTEFRNLAFDAIDQNLGREVGTHKKYVDRLKRILKKEGIPLWSNKKPYGFNVNEVASISATYNNKAYPYSQFVDLAEGKLNTQRLPNFQGSGFSTYLSELKDNLDKYKKNKNPNDLNKAKKVLDRFNESRKNYQKGTLKDYRLPKIFLDVPEAGKGYYKSVQDIYTPAKVKEYKEKFGLDLEEFGKKELYNIDVGKEAIPLEKAISPEYRPALLNNLKTIRKEFENNTDNICDLFGSRRLANGGVPNGCGGQFDEAVEKNPTKLLTDVAESNVGSSKIKGMAQRMLTIFPKLGTVGKIGTVAAGAGIALSGLRFNPEKGEIVTTDNDQKADQNQILQYVKDNPLKVTAGSSLGFAAQEVPGAYKAARDLGRGRVRSTLGISGAIRPVLTTFGTPLLTGLYEGAIGAKRLEEGETMTDVLTDPLGPALGISLMEPLSKMSGVVRDAKPVGILGGLKRAFNPFDMSNVGTARPGLTSKILRMGMSPRVIAGISRLGPYGMLAGAGLSALDQYNKYQNQEGMIYNLFND